MRAYLEQVWGEAAARFRLVAENTTPDAVIEPIRLAFEVACPADHAFEVWTGRIGQWWPADHTVSGEPGLDGRPRAAPRRPDLRTDRATASSTTGAR